MITRTRLASEELERLRPRLERACRGYLGERQDEAADFVQDAFMALPPDPALTEGLEARLSQSCLQLCMARLRCRDGIVRGLETELSRAGAVDGAVGASSEHLGIRKQAGLRLLGVAIQGLRVESRQVLQLRNVKGLAYAQIGATLDLAWDQVAERLLQAREELRASVGYGSEPVAPKNLILGLWGPRPG